MGLAIADFDGIEDGLAHFRLDIGTNRYYAYVVGDPKSATRIGDFTVLADVTNRSSLMGPVPSAARGRTVLTIPASAFDNEHRAVQIKSFREQSLSGPTYSDPVLVPRGGGVAGGFPAISFGTDVAPIRHLPYCKATRPISQAMFWGELISVVAPVAIDLVGKLLAPKTGAPPAAAPAPSSSSNDLVKLLTELIQKLVAGAEASGDKKAPAQPTSESLAVFSEAQVFPAALLALAPLLEKVLTPETVKTIANTADPNRLLGTISQALLDFAKVGLQANEQELEHLRKILPSTGPAADELLKDMGLSMGSNVFAGEPAYTRVRSVRIRFADLSLQTVGGRPQASFRNDRDLSFPLAIETPKPIRSARLVVRVKDAETLEVVAKRTYPVSEAITGRLGVVPIVPVDDVAKLVVGRDYLVHVALLWRRRSGARIGTSVGQLVSVVGEYSFDRIEQSTELIPLNDSQAHRDFWHKAWQGTFDRELRGVTFNCRYSYSLDATHRTNAQLATRTHLGEDIGYRQTGTLDTGLVISLYRLNELLSQLPGGTPLSDAELAGLATRAFTDRFGQAARSQVRFRGRPGDSSALWVFPEVKLDQVVLRRAEVVNDAGHVLRFSEQRVRFPVPALAHLIGVVSQ
jgi:hypothetical protein